MSTSRIRANRARCLLLAAIVSISACGGSSDGIGGRTPGDIGPAPSTSSADDRRPAILAELGGPDAFVLSADEDDGNAVRVESWSYFDAGTQIDFVDGEVTWNVEIGEIADGSLLPLLYDPMEFELLSSFDEVAATLDGITLVPIESASDLETDGAQLWAGEQIALAFVDDKLVYVETFPLVPGEQEVAG